MYNMRRIELTILVLYVSYLCLVIFYKPIYDKNKNTLGKKQRCYILIWAIKIMENLNKVSHHLTRFYISPRKNNFAINSLSEKSPAIKIILSLHRFTSGTYSFVELSNDELRKAMFVSNLLITKQINNFLI